MTDTSLAVFLKTFCQEHELRSPGHGQRGGMDRGSGRVRVGQNSRGKGGTTVTNKNNNNTKKTMQFLFKPFVHAVETKGPYDFD